MSANSEVNMPNIESDPFLARIQTVHPDGSPAIAPYIALTDKELRFHQGVGIMYAAIKGGEIVKIYKQPPIKRDDVSREQAIKNAGTKGFCKSAKIEYDRLIRGSQIKEVYRKQAWHKHLINHGCELWRGTFTTDHFCKPEKITYVEILPVELPKDQADRLGQIADDLHLLHKNLKESHLSMRPCYWETSSNFKTLSTLEMSAKHLNDFLKYMNQQESNTDLPMSEWLDPEW